MYCIATFLWRISQFDVQWWTCVSVRLELLSATSRLFIERCLDSGVACSCFALAYCPWSSSIVRIFLSVCNTRFSNIQTISKTEEKKPWPFLLAVLTTFDTNWHPFLVRPAILERKIIEQKYHFFQKGIIFWLGFFFNVLTWTSFKYFWYNSLHFEIWHFNTL